MNCRGKPRKMDMKIDLRVANTDTAEVTIADPGYPDSPDGADAKDWLEALKGDNREYRRLAG